jgi:hypothetical protein
MWFNKTNRREYIENMATINHLRKKNDANHVTKKETRLADILG